MSVSLSSPRLALFWKGGPASLFTVLLAEKRHIPYHIKYLLEKVHAQFTVNSKGTDIMHHLGITNSFLCCAPLPGLLLVSQAFIICDFTL